ncbi:MAG: hypothetical protein IKT60_02020, partial [Clostridia bacterium]|nr:hypothetical protein [Clostridia bacterium]
EELEPKMQKLQKEIEELSQKREPKVIEHYREKLTILQYALSQYTCPKEGEDVPESVIEAYFSKIVVKKDGFDWYIRINGDPDKPLHCKLEGKRRSTTKVVVTQDFSPALDSSTTGCYQGKQVIRVIQQNYRPAGFPAGRFSQGRILSARFE